jgi:alanyl-tRNA synthetase
MEMARRLDFPGGTHVFHAAEAWAFFLIEETAVAEGIRRISAVFRSAAAHQGIKKHETMHTKCTPACTLLLTDSLLELAIPPDLRLRLAANAACQCCSLLAR